MRNQRQILCSCHCCFSSTIHFRANEHFGTLFPMIHEKFGAKNNFLNKLNKYFHLFYFSFHRHKYCCKCILADSQGAILDFHSHRRWPLGLLPKSSNLRIQWKNMNRHSLIRSNRVAHYSDCWQLKFLIVFF